MKTKRTTENYAIIAALALAALVLIVGVAAMPYQEASALRGRIYDYGAFGTFVCYFDDQGDWLWCDQLG